MASFKVGENSKKVAIIMHVFGWGIPALFTVIGLAAQKITYPATYGWCFVGVDDNSAWEFALFFVPVLIISVIGKEKEK